MAKKSITFASGYAKHQFTSKEKVKLFDYILAYETEVHDDCINEIEKKFPMLKKSLWKKSVHNLMHIKIKEQEDYRQYISSLDTCYCDSQDGIKRKDMLRHIRNSISHSNIYYETNSNIVELIDYYTEQSKKYKKGDVSAYLRITKDSFWNVINTIINSQQL